MLLDKILDKNPYKTIYAIFLSEMKSDIGLRELYHRIYEETKEEFIQFCISEKLPEYIEFTNKASDFFINSLIMGANILGIDDETEIREMLTIMLSSYLKYKKLL